MLRPFLVTGSLFLLAACAALPGANNLADRSPQEVSLINDTCAKVMGLRRGEGYYGDCQDSLARSLAQRDAAYALSAADDACNRQGLKHGSPAFATCVLDRHSEGNAPALQPVTLSEGIRPGRSYYTVTPDVQFQRKRYACAQLGLTPGSGLFDDCLTGLQGSLLPDN